MAVFTSGPGDLNTWKHVFWGVTVLIGLLALLALAVAAWSAAAGASSNVDRSLEIAAWAGGAFVALLIGRTIVVRFVDS